MCTIIISVNTCQTGVIYLIKVDNNNSLFHKQYHMQKFELMIPITKQSLLKWEQMG